MDSEGLKQRTKELAHRRVKLAVLLPKTALGNHIRNQLIRCSTSVAAHYRAALMAQAEAAFISKIRIVINESHELASIVGTTRRTAQKRQSKQ